MRKIKLLLERFYLGETYTIGHLYIDGVYFCDTLEDRVRDYNKDGDLLDAGETKVFGETAIPYGLYSVIVNMSPRFKKRLPRLLKVLHFDGILMHGGRIAKHSHGCILIGKNTKVGQLEQSAIYMERLMKILDQPNVEISIQIV